MVITNYSVLNIMSHISDKTAASTKIPHKYYLIGLFIIHNPITTTKKIHFHGNGVSWAWVDKIVLKFSLPSCDIY